MGDPTTTSWGSHPEWPGDTPTEAAAELETAGKASAEAATNEPSPAVEERIVVLENPFEQQLEISRRNLEMYEEIAPRSLAASERTAAAMERLAAGVEGLLAIARMAWEEGEKGDG